MFGARFRAVDGAYLPQVGVNMQEHPKTPKSSIMVCCLSHEAKQNKPTYLMNKARFMWGGSKKKSILSAISAVHRNGSKDAQTDVLDGEEPVFVKQSTSHAHVARVADIGEDGGANHCKLLQMRFVSTSLTKEKRKPKKCRQLLLVAYKHRADFKWTGILK